MANEKQIGLALIQYAQDNNELFPPAARGRSPKERSISLQGFPEGLSTGPVVSWNEMLYPYLKTDFVFYCPEVTPESGIATRRDTAPFDYMYSDLAASYAMPLFSAPSRTAVLMDGEVQTINVGHAWTRTMGAQPAAIGHSGKVIPRFGATVRSAAVRHNGKANYLFADGHVKSLPPQDVFFQDRSDMRLSHLDEHKAPVGPDPLGDMTFAGKQYKATWQLR